MLVPSLQPNMDKLPMFLLRMATEVRMCVKHLYLCSSVILGVGTRLHLLYNDMPYIIVTS